MVLCDIQAIGIDCWRKIRQNQIPFKNWDGHFPDWEQFEAYIASKFTSLAIAFPMHRKQYFESQLTYHGREKGLVAPPAAKLPRGQEDMLGMFTGRRGLAPVVLDKPRFLSYSEASILIGNREVHDLEVLWEYESSIGKWACLSLFLESYLHASNTLFQVLMATTTVTWRLLLATSLNNRG